MYSIQDIAERSISPNELIVSYNDAMELIYIFERNGVRVLGWEGWLKFDEKPMQLSQWHQGTADLSALSNDAVYSLVKSTIMQAKEEWESIPEVKSAELYFCITTDS